MHGTNILHTIRAGKDSDIFVIPNLNVLYKEVSQVNWSNSTCSPDLDDDDEFLSSFVFDLQDGKQEALAFYSRFHIDNVKLPEILDAFNATDIAYRRVQRRDTICCGVSASGSCLGQRGLSFRKCNADDLDIEEHKYVTLIGSFIDWTSILSDADTNVNAAIENKRSVVDWFDVAGKEGMLTKDDKPGQPGMGGNIEIDNFEANLAPLTLIDGAEPLHQDQANEKVAKTNRIQFSGNSGQYTLTLNKEKSVSNSDQDCTQNEGIQWALNTLLSKQGASNQRRLKKEDDDRKERPEIKRHLHEPTKESQVTQRHADYHGVEIDKFINAYNKAIKQCRDDNSNKAGETCGNTVNKSDFGGRKLVEAKISQNENWRDIVGDSEKGTKAFIAQILLNLAQIAEDEVTQAEMRADREDRQSDAKEKRKQEGKDDRIKDRKQSAAAQSVATSQINDMKTNGSFENTASKMLSIPFTAFPILISSVIAGCNYEMSAVEDLRQILSEVSESGIGSKTGSGGGK